MKKRQRKTLSRAQWENAKPSLKQVEAVLKIARLKEPSRVLYFNEVKDTWTAGECSDYIGNKGDGSYYKVKERNKENE